MHSVKKKNELKLDAFLIEKNIDYPSIEINRKVFEKTLIDYLLLVESVLILPY